MTEERYRNLQKYWTLHPQAGKIVAGINHGLTGLVYCLYPLMLLFLLYEKKEGFLRAILVPAISFLILTIVRNKIGAERPYERYGIAPLIHKETKGNSFPSRHCFSIFVIAMTALKFFPLLGCILLICGVCLAIIRVIGGVHFVKDVLIGAAAGILAGILGFWIL